MPSFQMSCMKIYITGWLYSQNQLTKQKKADAYPLKQRTENHFYLICVHCTFHACVNAKYTLPLQVYIFSEQNNQTPKKLMQS